MLKSAIEIDKMRKAGLIVWHALHIAERIVRPGITTGEVNDRIEQFYADQKVIPVFKGVPGKVPFPAANCISVNEEVVHGIPGKRVLVEGDIVGIDTGCKVLDAGSQDKGWCGDSARTFAIGKIDAKKQKLLDVTQRILDIAIEEIPKQTYWSQVAKKMENHAFRNQFSVITALVGHGIGREMHEAPQVPNYVSQEVLRSDFKLVPGLVLAVEPMINAGAEKVRTIGDHWTIVTKDRQPSAHFEHTLAITGNGVRILTGPPLNDSERIDIAQYIA
ncbi:methionine aminopeptidase [Planctomycetales bacterium]|nr:methionine aminopeptidase [Planctomycetales bacterium]